MLGRLSANATFEFSPSISAPSHAHLRCRDACSQRMRFSSTMLAARAYTLSLPSLCWILLSMSLIGASAQFSGQCNENQFAVDVVVRSGWILDSICFRVSLIVLLRCANYTFGVYSVLMGKPPRWVLVLHRVVPCLIVFRVCSVRRRWRRCRVQHERRRQPRL